MKTLINSSRFALIAAVAMFLSASAALAGDPIHGVDIKLGSKSGGQSHRVRTDASGNFTFSNLPPGEYTLTITKSDFDNALRSSRVGDVDADGAEITLTKGKPGATSPNVRQAFTGITVTVGADGTVSGNIKSPRDAASGQASGKRQHGSGISPRDAGSGMATGKR